MTLPIVSTGESTKTQMPIMSITEESGPPQKEQFPHGPSHNISSIKLQVLVKSNLMFHKLNWTPDNASVSHTKTKHSGNVSSSWLMSYKELLKHHTISVSELPLVPQPSPTTFQLFNSSKSLKWKDVTDNHSVKLTSPYLPHYGSVQMQAVPTSHNNHSSCCTSTDCSIWNIELMMPHLPHHGSSKTLSSPTNHSTSKNN